MNSRDRYLTVFRHEEPDRVPLLLNISQLYFENKSVQWRNQLERADVLLELGLDPTIDIWLPDPVPHPEVKIKTWRVFNKKEGLPLIYKEYHTPAGVLRQIVRETADWCSPLHNLWVPTILGTHQRKGYGMELFDDWNVSRHVEPWVKGPEDLEKLRYLINVPVGWLFDEWREDALRAIEFAKMNNLLTIVRRTIVGDAFQWFCDIPTFLCAMIDNPTFVKEFLEIFHRWAIEQTKLVLELDIDVFMRRGWYETPDFWGPKYFEKYLKPSIQEETELVHQAGKFHCYLLTEGHGHYLDIFETMDVDILWGVDPIMGGVNLEEIKRRLGRQKTLIGGVNAEITLRKSNEEEIQKSTREAIQAMATGGGFVLMPVAGIWPEIPWENVEIMINEWKEFGKYPLT